MVIIPILGEAFLDIKDYLLMPNPTDIAPISLISGFLAAFIVGCIACKWMINIVKRGKLIYFAVCVFSGYSIFLSYIIER